MYAHRYPTRRVPALVIHGGAGSISRANLPRSSPQYAAYVLSLRAILAAIYPLLVSGASALDAATAAVRLFEDNPLFNAGKGAVFNSAGGNELEASVMVSRGAQKRGVGVELLTRVKNPIMLAKELLMRQEREESAPRQETTRHNCISGREAERLAEVWGCEIVDEGYFYTDKRWQEHLRGLKQHGRGVGLAEPVGFDEEEEEENEELHEYLPQGTVGCVALDIYGTLCVATSTGGLTNKIPGRIGDTPTLGAGFWAEEWQVPVSPPRTPVDRSWAGWIFAICFSRAPIETGDHSGEKQSLLFPSTERRETRAVALSGTGNGDYFLRLAAAHSVAARCRFGGMDLQSATEEMVGVDGEMQKSAGGRWGMGDGEGGFIGIDEKGKVVMVMNCGGMFRGYIDDDGKARVGVFRDEEET
ncbi:hypothetical protein Q9L58_000391 [Maublancomyces gigas]|uniref:Asparaginase n=1 Tax=Discina gigas TaxID=1032678 RepID=A0ABR3GWT4_9PEZI